MGKRGDIKVSIHPSIHSSFKSPARISLFLPLANMTRRSCTIYVVGITCAVLLAVGIGLFAGQVFRTLMNNRLKKVKGKHTHRYILLPFKAAWMSDDVHFPPCEWANCLQGECWEWWTLKWCHCLCACVWDPYSFAYPPILFTLSNMSCFFLLVLLHSLFYWSLK